MTPNTNINSGTRLPAWIVLALAMVMTLAGCLTPFRAPPDVAHLRLTAADSPTVIVDKVWLERPAGSPLTVTGYVVRKLGAEDTTGTRLEISLRDGTGRVLRTDMVDFEPRQIPRRNRLPAATAQYRHPLDPLPAGTVEVSVRAVDRPSP
jgi:hypothetical protein